MLLRATRADHFPLAIQGCAAGPQAFSVVADDGWLPAVRDLLFDVHSVTAVVAPALAFSLRAGPNPATETVSVALALSAGAPVGITIHDVSGRFVARLMTEAWIPPGQKSWEWRPDQLPNGMYFVRARIGSRVIERRFVWLGR
jgi:hypothetical protein